MSTTVSKNISSLPQLVLLDWDGTLVDSFAFLKAAHNSVREAFGHDLWDDTAYKEIVRHSTRDIYGKLYGEREDEARRILYEYIDMNHADSLIEMENASRLLEFLHNNGIQAGIVSNKNHESLVADIEAMSWGQYISVTVGAGRAPLDKPAPDPIFMAVSELGYQGDIGGIWYVGDTATDLECATAAGVTSVFMLHGMGDASLVEQYSPLYVFQDLGALISVLGNNKSCG